MSAAVASTTPRPVAAPEVTPPASPILNGKMYTALALVCTLLWASAQLGVKVGLASAPPLYLMAIRFIAAGLILQPVCWAVGSPWPKTWGGMGRLVALGLLNNTIYLGLTALALQTVEAGMNCVLAGVNPLALALGGYLIFGERTDKKELLGLFGALLGVVWVMAARIGADNQPSGIALTLLANCVMVAGNLAYKQWQHESGLVRSHSVQLLVGGVTLLGLAGIFESADAIVWGANLFRAEAFLVVGVSFGAMLSWLYLLSNGSAAKAGSFLFLVPLFGMLQSAWLLGERMTLRDMFGVGLTTLSVYAVQRFSQPAPAKAA
jgi:drug/metabolite transporter (DMT)-like permease